MSFFETLSSESLSQPFIGTCYHWAAAQAPDLDFKKQNKAQALRVCDDYLNHGDYRKGDRLYMLDIVFRTPLVLLNQLADFDDLFPQGEDTLFSVMRERGGFDSIVYTPHRYGPGTRQAIILNPITQVLRFREIVDYSRELIDAYRSHCQPHWRRLMGDLWPS